MDPLATLLTQFTPTAHSYFHGRQCHTARYDGRSGCGHLHVLKRGHLRLQVGDGATIELTEPSVVMLPSPQPHSLHPCTEDAELICARLTFGGGLDGPLASALPAYLITPLANAPELAALIRWLVTETSGQGPAKTLVLNRLFELLAIALLRQQFNGAGFSSTLLAGLADPRLSRALAQLHAHPEQRWTVATLASVAHMSRASFAARFRLVMGATPAHYLASWRLSLAQKLLREGRSISVVADTVGYQSPSALARAFRRVYGISPGQWLKNA